MSSIRGAAIEHERSGAGGSPARIATVEEDALARKVIITCAVTGAGDTTQKNPVVPVTPEEIATSSIDAACAGAAAVHIHVRDPKTGQPSMEPAFYRETVQRIRESGVDVITNLTTGAGARFVPDKDDLSVAGPGSTLSSPQVRVRHIEELLPEICSLDMGSLNFGQHVFINSPPSLLSMARAIKAAGVKPELEVFEAGHIHYTRQLIESGEIEGEPLFQIVLGVPWGAPATPEAMIFMRDQLPPGCQWSAFGTSSTEFPMAALAVILGGHVRVGLEDNLYLARGQLAPSNAALVERAVNIVESLGESVASPAEAREILSLPAR
jgi:uncharacterized protein (DUF849 family)